MEIRNLGSKTLWIKGKSESLLINPADTLLAENKHKSRIIIFSDGGPRKILDNDRVVINGPGEYEIGGIEVRGIRMSEAAIAYVLTVDGVKIGVVLGGGSQEIEKISSELEVSDILVVEAGAEDRYLIGLAHRIGVNYLIPLAGEEERQKLEAFLDAADTEGKAAVESLKIERTELPEGMEVVVLKANDGS